MKPLIEDHLFSVCIIGFITSIYIIYIYLINNKQVPIIFIIINSVIYLIQIGLINIILHRRIINS